MYLYFFLFYCIFNDLYVIIVLGDLMEICTNPDVLRVIYFIKILINIIMIILPIGLILWGIIDVSKATISGEEGEQKKIIKLFFKRFVYTALVFAMIWIVNVVMNLLGDLTNGVSFMACWENANASKIEELDKANNNSNSDSNNNSSNSDNSDGSKDDKIILIGDSRTNGMCQINSIKNDSNVSCIAKDSMGYAWLSGKFVTNELKNLLEANPDSYVVSNFGVNDTGNVTSYATFYNNLIVTYPNIKLVFVSVNPINDEKAKKNGYYATDSDVVNFNKTIKPLLDDKIIYCDTYHELKNTLFFETSDGVHYTSKTYNDIYDEIRKCLK